MKPFALDSSHTSMSGVFYPTGQVFAMFPSAELTRQAATSVADSEHVGECFFADAATIQTTITRTAESGDAPMPSVGAEADFVRRIGDLAKSGYCGLLIAMDKHDEPEKLAQTLDAAGAVVAFYYRTLVIEVLVEKPLPGVEQSVNVGTHAAAVQPDDRKS